MIMSDVCFWGSYRSGFRLREKKKKKKKIKGKVYSKTLLVCLPETWPFFLSSIFNLSSIEKGSPTYMNDTSAQPPISVKSKTRAWFPSWQFLDIQLVPLSPLVEKKRKEKKKVPRLFHFLALVLPEVILLFSL